MPFMFNHAGIMRKSAIKWAKIANMNEKCSTFAPQ